MAHVQSVHCFSCNGVFDVAAGDRVAFGQGCGHCGTDLHVCLNCTHHDPAAYNECRESSAERVADRDRANRCEYFRPGNREGGEGGGIRDEALADLDSLFKKP